LVCQSDITITVTCLVNLVPEGATLSLNPCDFSLFTEINQAV